MKKYDTVGIDCVAMCVNDILCHGASPLFFLDYIACGKLDAETAAEIVKGVSLACLETGAALLGGETAEHPGVIPDDVYDIAGFAVGIVDRKSIIDGQKIREVDALLGLASSGVHSNGFSLIRKVIPDLNEDFDGQPIGLALLEPTRLYVKPILKLMEEIEIHGMVHITGGGFFENVPRMLPGNVPPLSAIIYDGAWKIPPIFDRIADGIKKAGRDQDIKQIMFNTFNMGIGFVLALAPDKVEKAAAILEEMGYPAWEIGKVEKSPGKLTGKLPGILPDERLRFV
jgi:phosphoribosylformylglycinamidine cyclo-ligase